PAPHAASDAPSRLELIDVGDTKLRNLNLKVGPGEIVGVAGLGGSGRSRLLRVIFGESAGYSGEIWLDGKACRFRSALDAIEAGIGLVTEDRMHDGFVGTLPIWNNITLPWSGAYSRGGLLNLRKERRAALDDAARVSVKMPSIDALMAQLSGGNQQKAIFARWVSSSVELLLLDEPTHGVDVGSKAQIYDIIRGLTQRGVSVLLVSSDLEELVGLSDRVLILSDGRFQSELTGQDISKDRILHKLLDDEETP
ncbi:sugar ABC transporter ATP-binding protein, partial [Mesorhizobium sp. M7A.F.Ca.US.006.01.1.1]|uniref:ATP-binding cassette domain-containing protein n=1 Tax=Mesorhizobium sp. M7A.F.Ca.US.006.01.1.1 TaxID=2496707 RepID=UPI000FD4C4BA